MTSEQKLKFHRARMDAYSLKIKIYYEAAAAVNRGQPRIITE